MRKCQVYPIWFGTGHGYRFTSNSNDDVEIVRNLLKGTDSSGSTTWFLWQESWRKTSFLPRSADYGYRAIQEISYVSSANLLQRNHGESSSF